MIDPPTPAKIPGIQLNLTPEEAKTLSLVLDKVGGDPKTTLRVHAAAVLEALSNVGFKPWLYEAKHEINSGSFYFQ